MKGVFAMSQVVEKVTAFVVRPAKRGGHDLLLFRHPSAGVQIPAGTVEDGERPEDAVLREAAEETGLFGLTIRQNLGSWEENLPPGQAVVAERTQVYARPDPTSIDWAFLRRGLAVNVLRRAAGFTQIKYEEFNCTPDPEYVTLSILGWVPGNALAYKRVRHFFLLRPQSWTPDEPWNVSTESQVYTLFWAPLGALPPIIPPQDTWLAMLDKAVASLRA